jgi:hypothetical protein
MVSIHADVPAELRRERRRAGVSVLRTTLNMRWIKR